MPAAGNLHSILLKSDGTAAAFGSNSHVQCYIPGPPEGITYTQVAAGDEHTVLLKSDGTAAAFGGMCHGQCNIPALADGVKYTSNEGMPRTVLSLHFGNGYASLCLLTGEERLRIEVNAADSFSDLRLRYVKGMEGPQSHFSFCLLYTSPSPRDRG